jgi:hypothetical protein
MHRRRCSASRMLQGPPSQGRWGRGGAPSDRRSGRLGAVLTMLGQRGRGHTLEDRLHDRRERHILSDRPRAQALDERSRQQEAQSDDGLLRLSRRAQAPIGRLLGDLLRRGWPLLRIILPWRRGNEGELGHARRMT